MDHALIKPSLRQSVFVNEEKIDEPKSSPLKSIKSNHRYEFAKMFSPIKIEKKLHARQQQNKSLVISRSNLSHNLSIDNSGDSEPVLFSSNLDICSIVAGKSGAKVRSSRPQKEQLILKDTYPLI